MNDLCWEGLFTAEFHNINNRLRQINTEDIKICYMGDDLEIDTTICVINSSPIFVHVIPTSGKKYWFGNCKLDYTYIETRIQKWINSTLKQNCKFIHCGRINGIHTFEIHDITPTVRRFPINTIRVRYNGVETLTPTYISPRHDFKHMLALLERQVSDNRRLNFVPSKGYRYFYNINFINGTSITYFDECFPSTDYNSTFYITTQNLGECLTYTHRYSSSNIKPDLTFIENFIQKWIHSAVKFNCCVWYYGKFRGHDTFMISDPDINND